MASLWISRIDRQIIKFSGLIKLFFAAMNALLGCPILLPTVPLNELTPSILVVISNCCIEAVNTFARGIVLSSSAHSPPRRLLAHPLSSTLICRLIQIASLRCCLYAVLLRRVKNAALTASAAEVPRSVYEALDTMTFDPTFVCTTAGHPISVKRFPIFVPSGGKKSTVSKWYGLLFDLLLFRRGGISILCTFSHFFSQKRPSRGTKGRPRKRVCTKSILDATEQDENGDGGAEDEEEAENGEGVDPTSVDLEGGEVLEQTAAVNRLAGVSAGRRSNALLSDVRHNCFILNGVCSNAMPRWGRFSVQFIVCAQVKTSTKALSLANWEKACYQDLFFLFWDCYLVRSQDMHQGTDSANITVED